MCNNHYPQYWIYQRSMQFITVIKRILFLSPWWMRQGPSQRGRLEPSPIQKTFKKKEIADKGFTLIETIMTIVILSIAVVGILQVFFSGLAPRNAPMSIEITIGTQLVQEGLERIKADRQNTARGFSYITSANYQAESLSGAFSGYTRTTTISSWPIDTDTTKYKQVSVAVTHSSRTVANVTTIVANY